MRGNENFFRNHNINLSQNHVLKDFFKKKVLENSVKRYIHSKLFKFKFLKYLLDLRN